MQAPTPILIERRFPLALDESDSAIRALYESAKAGRWDPYRDIDWAALAKSALPAPVRDAARRAYSRRAWTEYTGLTETPAVLIRFCLEAGREADPKYFLSVRNTEEAWHIECFSAVAEAFGGALPTPANGAFAALFNQRRHTRALDADESLDAYVATYCAIEDELELQLAEAALANSRDPVLVRMWTHIVADKRRHAEFGWLYVDSRGARWDAAARANVGATIAGYLRDNVAAGYHCVSLAAPGFADDFVAAEREAAAAGLGGVDAAAERSALAATLAKARARLARFGVTIDPIDHPRAGAL